MAEYVAKQNQHSLRRTSLDKKQYSKPQLDNNKEHAVSQNSADLVGYREKTSVKGLGVLQSSHLLDEIGGCFSTNKSSILNALMISLKQSGPRKLFSYVRENFTKCGI